MDLWFSNSNTLVTTFKSLQMWTCGFTKLQLWSFTFFKNPSTPSPFTLSSSPPQCCYLSSDITYRRWQINPIVSKVYMNLSEFDSLWGQSNTSLSFQLKVLKKCISNLLLQQGMLAKVSMVCPRDDYGCRFGFHFDYIIEKDY